MKVPAYCERVFPSSYASNRVHEEIKAVALDSPISDHSPVGVVFCLAWSEMGEDLCATCVHGFDLICP